MADLARALELMKALDLEQLERQDQLEMAEVISILESAVGDTQEEAPPETEEPVEVEPDSSEVTVDDVMEGKLEEATKEALDENR